MPNIRVMLWVAFAALLYLNYEAWNHDYAAPAPILGAGTANPPARTLGDSIPQSTNPQPGATTPVPSPPAAAGAPGPAALGTALPGAPVGGVTPGPSAIGAPLHVVTDVLDILIDLKGGELERADIREYPLHKDNPNVPVRLLNRDSDATLYVLQSGLVGAPGEAAPTHLATWTAEQTSYQLAPEAEQLLVPLTWNDGQGLAVTKTFVFTRGGYAIGLKYAVQNAGPRTRTLASYAQFLRHWEHASRSYFDVETYSFKGPAVWDGSKSIDLKVENETESKFAQTVTNGWLASLQHHFVSAIVPAANQADRYQLQVQDHEYLLSSTGPMTPVAAGAGTVFETTLFVGPKLQAQLAATGPQLQRTVDYGKLTVLSQPLFATLKWVHSLIGNWGWSIILVTALIKLLFYPLSQASGRSMAKMRAVAPRMKQIQDSFKDDREKLGRAMMELYKKEKINPLAGCLPMVVQIPFFISFYWVLLESVEMRQAPFMLWINDLSSRDPFFVLPLLMGSAMFAQFKLNPAPPDPMQARIMQFMPLVMTGMMAWFPSGLVLYWLTNTVLSIVQQWRINQVVGAVAAKPRA